MISELIARDLGIPAGYIQGLAKTASHRYYSFKIPRKRGGEREIHHPSRELKLLQRWLAKNVFGRLPIHHAAYGYREGLNILQHAAVHSRYNFLLKLDFRDFFPSIRSADIVNLLRTNVRVLGDVLTSASDYETISLIVCRHGNLTIGAPSSPIISNLVMFEFDRAWAERSHAQSIAYSRYADDLCFSTDHRNLLADLLAQLRKDIAGRESPRLQLNEDKTVFTSRKRLRLVTGLVLTPTKRISVGRAKKRAVKCQVYRFSKKLLSEEETISLRGILSYIQSVEPSFVQGLREKFGPDVMGSIGA
jgi:RNA-directed DNA polymerase